jgi:hypothetical protein
MASLRAIAERRAVVIGRLDGVKTRLAESLGVTFEEQPLTNRDPELSQIQQLENVAGMLEAVETALAPAAAEVAAVLGTEEPEEPKELKPKTAEALKAVGIMGPGESQRMTDEELLEVKGVGPAVLAEIREVHGPYLEPEQPEGESDEAEPDAE